MCPALLHAAAFDNSISKVILVSGPLSYRSLVMNRFYKFDFSCAVAGALTAYDLPDLAGCIAPRQLVLADPKNEMKEPALKALVDQELAFPRAIYSAKNVPGNLKVLEAGSFQSLSEIVE